MGYYDAIADGYDELHGEEQANKFAITLKHIKIGNDATVLDVGCGTGLSYKHLSSKITGLDDARKTLEIAKGRLDEVVCGSGEKLPFKDLSFEVVISMTVIHNLIDFRSGISEIARTASKYAVISVLKNSKMYNDIIHAIEAVFKKWERKKDNTDPNDTIFILIRPGT